MKFLDYIKGNRRGPSANRIEKNAMQDPFMQEAIEGFDSMDEDHIARIEAIRKRIQTSHPRQKKRHILLQLAVACSVIIAALGGYLLIESYRSNLYAQESPYSSIMNVYVPKVFYEENIAVIAHSNTILARNYKPNISKFEIADNERELSISDKEHEMLSRDVLAGSDNEAMDVYIPDEFYDRSSEVKDEKPRPIIGFDRYKTYLKKALRRPTDDICGSKKGKVGVEFSVDKNGQPYDLVVKYSLCGTSDKEAIRLIESGPKWITGTERVLVKVEF